MSDLVYDRVQQSLLELKLSRMAEVLDPVSEEAARSEQTYLEFLDQLLTEEQTARYQRRVAMKTKLARFPYVKTLEQFDFSFQPSIDERRIRELATLRFVANGENLILLGPPGVGKTHLAVALGVLAVAQGHNPYFITVPELLELLEKDAKEGRLQQRMRALCKPGLLILDEMGYLPINQMAAHFLFQLVARRYEKGSILITSNKSYGQWGEIFFSDNILAAALLDRLLHHSTTINIRGQSYRLREKRKAGIFQEPGELLTESDSDTERR